MEHPNDARTHMEATFMVGELEQAVCQVRDDPGVRVVVITGAGERNARRQPSPLSSAVYGPVTPRTMQNCW
jgi:hypothetical protein